MKQKTIALLSVLTFLVGVLMLTEGQPRYAASLGPRSAPAEASLRLSKPLAAPTPALPTPSPVQASREPQRRPRTASPASRSRTYSVEGLPAILLRIRGCESGNGPNDPGDYSNVNSLSGASGAFQFLDSTWHYVTGLPGKARDYSRSTQDWGALKLYRSEGTRPWNSSRYCWS